MSERIAKYRKQFIEEWFEFNPWLMFMFLCIVYFTLMYVKRIFIIDTIAAFEILNERGDIWMFDIIYGIQYLSVPIFLIWKFTWTTLLLWIGSFMFGYRLLFKDLWKLVMICELVFFIPELLKVIWFTVVSSDPNYFDYQAFYPLSIINLVDYKTIAMKWHYPAKALNLFEIVYWLFLSCGIYFMSGKRLSTSFYIVSTTYILFFFVWLIFYLTVY